MRGPFIPLYGSGAVMMLLVSRPFQKNLFMLYIAGCIGATVLEYITGVLMEALFKVRYWDYTGQPFNYKGHICLGSSLTWGGLTILMTEVVHRPVEKLMLQMPINLLVVITLILTIYIVADITVSFRAAMDLRNVLMHMEKVKEELSRVQKRLEVIIAVADNEITVKKEAIVGTVSQVKDGLVSALRMDELKDSIEDKLKTLKNYKASEYLEGVKEEITELKTKYRVYMELHDRSLGLRALYNKRIIRNNPTMSSKRFKVSLEELKKLAEIRTKRKHDKEVQEKDSIENE